MVIFNIVVNYFKKYKFIIMFLLIILLLLKTIYSIYLFEFKYKSFDQYKKMELMVVSLEKISDSKVSYIVKYNKDKFLLNIYLDDINTKEECVKYKYGDVLQISGKIVISESLGNPYEFNYKRYLNSNGIIGTITSYKVSKIQENKGNIFCKLIYTYKDLINDKIDENLNEKEANLLKSILFSYDLYLDSDVKENISNVGLSYILNVSGKNISYILVISYFFRKFYKKNTVKFIQVFLLIFLLILSSTQITTLRAFIVALISIIIPDNIKFSRIKKLIISMYIIVLINPYSIFNFSFIFSYLCVLSTIFLYQPLKSIFGIYINKVLIKISKFKYKKLIQKFLIKFNSLICFNICIIIFTFPLQIYLFNSFSLVSIISNILIIPLLSFVQCIGYISMLTIYFLNVSDVLILSCYLPLKLIIKIVEFLNLINIKIDFVTPSIVSILFYYLIIILILIKENLLKKLVLKYKKIRYKLKLLSNVLIITLSIYIVFEQVYINYFEEYVYFFNVKQGNMCVIRKNRQTIIVDMGSTTKKLAGNILNTFLKAKNIKNIDLILITHMHEDHLNGLFCLDEKIKVNQVAYGKIWHIVNNEYILFEEFIKQKNAKDLELSRGENINLKDVVIECLSPKSDEKIYSQDEINSNSGVYLITIKDNNKSKKILFMGDATIETEKDILLNYNNINLQNIDVLQVGHHGSKTSTTEELIKITYPKIALISSYKKVYSHPSDETIETLKKYNINIHITEENKALKIDL